MQTLKEMNLHMAIAFIYLSDELVESALIEERMKKALWRIGEGLSTARSTSQEP